MLNFDPHRWIKDHDGPPAAQSVATVATVAGTAAENEKSSSPDSAATPATPATLRPTDALKLCDKGLASLDPAKPLHGLDAGRWRQLLDDAQWLRDSFGPVAVRHGWEVGELFGLWWWMPPKVSENFEGKDSENFAVLKPGWGGIADRLQGSRSLVMDEDRATWRPMFMGEPDQFNRTAYPDLRPLWEVPDHG